MKENKDTACTSRLRDGYGQNIVRLLDYINELDAVIIQLDKMLDIHQPIFIGRGRVRLENYYFRFFKQKKLKNTDKWIFLRIPSKNLFQRINHECLNEVTKPVFQHLKKLVDERNRLYKMLSMFNRSMNLVKEPKSTQLTNKLLDDLKLANMK